MSIVERAVERMGTASAERIRPNAAVAAFTLAPAPTTRAGTRDHSAYAALPGQPALPELEIDPRWMRRQNFITPDSGRTMIAEDFRRIKRHVLTATPKPRIMVTSALPGEGKTFCAINLAVSVAMELDRSVILVDADTVRPSVLRTLGVADGLPGLMDALADGNAASADAMIRRTQIGKLSVLPSGSHRANATELLASDVMRALVQELSDRHPDQIVIFDSPPLLVASESAALAGHMSQIMMVVAARQTTEVALKEALKRLEDCNCPIGLVLNKSEDHGAGYGYYGYGQGYGAGNGS